MVRNWDIFLNFVPSLPERVTKWRFHAQGIKRDMRGQPRLLYCGAFSIYANVRSGQIEMEPVIISITPPIVAFLTSKLIAYFNPSSRIGKIAVYGGFGVICAISMLASAFHIIDTVDRNGQDWRIGLLYVFHDRCTNATRSRNSGTKDTTTLTAQSTQKPQVTQPVTVPAKKTTASKTAKPL